MNILPEIQEHIQEAIDLAYDMESAFGESAEETIANEISRAITDLTRAQQSFSKLKSIINNP